MIDLLIVGAFVLYSLASGLRARRQASESLENYVLAGRSLPGWKAGASMAATQFAADTPLLVTGLVATAGIFALWRLWVYALAFLALSFIFAALWRRSGVVTDAELAELRYGGRGALLLRLLKAVYYSTVINCVVLAMVLIAVVRFAEVFMPWHEWLPAAVYAPIVQAAAWSGIGLETAVADLPPAAATANALISLIVIALFAAAYATTGGLRSVVNTDAAQLVLALGGTALYAWIVMQAAGGLAEIPDRLAALYGQAEAARLLSWAPTSAGEALTPLLVIISLQWFFQMNSDGTGYLAQRAIACRTDKDARVAGLVFTWVQILLRSLLWLVIAAGLLIIFPFTPQDAAAPGFAAAREATFVTGIETLLPPGARGLMLTALLAALASTVDTHLNWGASYWANDVYGRLVCREWRGREPRPRELVTVARLSNVAILAIAFVIMLNLGSIQAAWSISLLFGAGMGSVLVLRWLWERITLSSELAAMAVSIIAAPLLLFWLGTDPETEWIRLGAMALLSTAAAILVTFVTPPTPQPVLQAFYRRVRPPGWWRKAAAETGEEGRRPVSALGRGLTSTALTALSLFLLLAGLGQLLLPVPGAAPWLPAALALAGAALIPVWWYRAARPDV